jgi:S1-C subfamily serine protease
VHPGDQVMQIGNAPMVSLADVRATLLARKPGDKLTLHVRRNGETMELAVEVGTPPQPEKD